MVFPFVCRPRYAHCGTFFNGMEPANDGVELFYLPAWFHLYLRRRGRIRLARDFAPCIVKENNIPACRARVRRYMGVMAFTALVYRRSVNATLGTSYTWHIPLFLAWHNL